MNVNSLEEITQLIKHRLNIGCKNAAVRFGNEVHKIYETAINGFYNSYKPIMYDRTDSLKKAEMGVGGRDKYYKQLSQMEYLSGITVGSENIPGEPYEKNPPHGWNLSKWVIFDRSYESGIHGFSIADLKMLNKYRNKGERQYFKTVPPVARKKPAVEMRKGFRGIATKKYAENIILREEVNKAFGTQVV